MITPRIDRRFSRCFSLRFLHMSLSHMLNVSFSPHTGHMRQSVPGFAVIMPPRCTEVPLSCPHQAHVLRPSFRPSVAQVCRDRVERRCEVCRSSRRLLKWIHFHTHGCIRCRDSEIASRRACRLRPSCRRPLNNERGVTFKLLKHLFASCHVCIAL